MPTAMPQARPDSDQRTCADSPRVSPLVAQLLHDSYGREGSQPLYRAGWRDGIAHAVKLVRAAEQRAQLMAALHELAACDVGDEVEG